MGYEASHYPLLRINRHNITVSSIHFVGVFLFRKDPFFERIIAKFNDFLVVYIKLIEPGHSISYKIACAPSDFFFVFRVDCAI